jgi:hypothetical protein
MGHRLTDQSVITYIQSNIKIQAIMVNLYLAVAGIGDDRMNEASD